LIEGARVVSRRSLKGFVGKRDHVGRSTFPESDFGKSEER
jgi:hypothetical protein